MTTPTPRRSRRAVAPVTDPTQAAPEHQAPEHQAPEHQAPEHQAPEHQAPGRPTDPQATEAAAFASVASTVQLTKAGAAAPDVPGAPLSTRDGTGGAPTTTTAPRGVRALLGRAGRLAVALALVGVVTLAAGAVFAVRAHQLRSTDSASNLALVDTSLTNEAISSVSANLNRVFTYDYADPAATQAAASELLVGDASSQYKTLFDALQSKASGQKLTLKTTTVLAGVTALTPDSARLLVFLDQSSTRASDSSSSTAAAQLDVAAVRVDGMWKISEIRPL